MPLDFKEIVYGATAWAIKHPIAQEDIEPTFKLAREVFDETGFSGRKCALEVFAAYEPEADLRYAEAVKTAAEKNNLIIVSTIFRPKGNPSMVSSDRRERKNAVAQFGRGLEFAVAATPDDIPVVVNGPFQLVHGLGREEYLGRTRRGYLIDCLKQIGNILEAKKAYAALEVLRQSETKMNSQPEYWLSLLNKVGSFRLGLLVDTVHFFEGNKNNVEQMLIDVNNVCREGRCYSVHLSNRPRTEWEEKGDIAKHTGAILQTLKRYGCNVTVDYEGFDHSLDNVVGINRRPDQKDQIEVFKRSMAYLAGHVKRATG